MLGLDVGYQVETEGRLFDGVSADIRGGPNIWVTFGSTLADHLTHCIHDAIALWVRPPFGRTGAALEVEARDGTRTVLELSRPEDYALPPGANR